MGGSDDGARGARAPAVTGTPHHPRSGRDTTTRTVRGSSSTKLPPRTWDGSATASSTAALPVPRRTATSEPARPFVRRAGMRIACQGILGTRFGTPSRPGWSWPESTSGLSRSLEAGEPSAWSPGTVTLLLSFSGRRWSGSWGRGVVPWNSPETNPARWHKLVSTARCVTSIRFDMRRGGRARLKASDSKSDRGVSPSGVQILSPPPNSSSAFVKRSSSAEGWPSGRRCGTGNAVYGQLYRGFESHPLRHIRFRWAVLDGEVAVPCNPQSATAGLNSPLRAARVE